MEAMDSPSLKAGEYLRALGSFLDQFRQDFQLGVFRLRSSRRHPGAGDFHLRDLLQQRQSCLPEGFDVIAIANEPPPSFRFKRLLKTLLKGIDAQDPASQVSIGSGSPLQMARART